VRVSLALPVVTGEMLPVSEATRREVHSLPRTQKERSDWLSPPVPSHCGSDIRSRSVATGHVVWFLRPRAVFPVQPVSATHVNSLVTWSCVMISKDLKGDRLVLLIREARRVVTS
jgi:hypothetical protein